MAMGSLCSRSRAASLQFSLELGTIMQPYSMNCRRVYLVWNRPRGGEPLHTLLEPALPTVLWIMLPARHVFDGTRPPQDHEGRGHGRHAQQADIPVRPQPPVPRPIPTVT